MIWEHTRLQPISYVLIFGRIDPVTSRKLFIILIRWVTVIVKTKIPKTQSLEVTVGDGIAGKPIRGAEGHEKKDKGAKTQGRSVLQSARDLEPIFGRAIAQLRTGAHGGHACKNIDARTKDDVNVIQGERLKKSISQQQLKHDDEAKMMMMIRK